MMDEPRQGYYGGETAAPVFKQIAEAAANYLNIRPEDSGEPSVPEPAGLQAEERASKPGLRTVPIKPLTTAKD